MIYILFYFTVCKALAVGLQVKCHANKETQTQRDCSCISRDKKNYNQW